VAPSVFGSPPGPLALSSTSGYLKLVRDKDRVFSALGAAFTTGFELGWRVKDYHGKVGAGAVMDDAE
jgi:hypothetical protein